MKIYAVLWDDHHADTSVHLFTDLNVARSWAEEKALEYCYSIDDIKETEIDGWLYHVEYGPEGDRLWITEHEVL